MGRRPKRIRITDRTAVYHCISRILRQEPFLQEPDKERLNSLIKRQAAFAGIQILTHCIMGNHLHILLRIPIEEGLTLAQHREKQTDDEILKRCVAFYGDSSDEVIKLKDEITSLGKFSDNTRSRLLERMYELSAFMKELKKNFTDWFNHTHGREGILWRERFKSIVVDENSEALGIVARYIDLNPVRASMKDDPKDYRWCGYAQAVAGDESARKGISHIEKCETWAEASELYRMKLFSKAGQSNHSDKRALSDEEVEKVLGERGKLSEHQLVLVRTRYFIDGVAIGTSAFTDEIFAKFRDRFGATRKSGARPIPYLEHPPLTTLRNLLTRPLG